MTPTKQQTTNKKPSLRGGTTACPASPGKQPHWLLSPKPETLTTLVSAAWNITYTALWNAEEFTPGEIRNARRFISTFIMAYADPYRGYLVFTQRVLLTREYLNNNPEKWLPLPSIWFDTENLNGFARTEKWYRSMENVRLALPLYRNHYKALAEAIVEILEEPTAANFHYWRSWFLERGKRVTISLYLAAVANCQLNHL